MPAPPDHGRFRRRGLAPLLVGLVFLLAAGAVLVHAVGRRAVAPGLAAGLVAAVAAVVVIGSLVLLLEDWSARPRDDAEVYGHGTAVRIDLLRPSRSAGSGVLRRDGEPLATLTTDPHRRQEAVATLLDGSELRLRATGFTAVGHVSPAQPTGFVAESRDGDSAVRPRADAAYPDRRTAAWTLTLDGRELHHRTRVGTDPPRRTLREPDGTAWVAIAHDGGWTVTLPADLPDAALVFTAWFATVVDHYGAVSGVPVA
ncbi:MAG: hypothetical protein AB7J32_13985 [Pseudonocardia sp.]